MARLRPILIVGYCEVGVNGPWRTPGVAQQLLMIQLSSCTPLKDLGTIRPIIVKKCCIRKLSHKSFHKSSSYLSNVHFIYPAYYLPQNYFNNPASN